MWSVVRRSKSGTLRRNLRLSSILCSPVFFITCWKTRRSSAHTLALVTAIESINRKSFFFTYFKRGKQEWTCTIRQSCLNYNILADWQLVCLLFVSFWRDTIKIKKKENSVRRNDRSNQTANEARSRKTCVFLINRPIGNRFKSKYSEEKRIKMTIVFLFFLLLSEIDKMRPHAIDDRQLLL